MQSKQFLADDPSSSHALTSVIKSTVALLVLDRVLVISVQSGSNHILTLQNEPRSDLT